MLTDNLSLLTSDGLRNVLDKLVAAGQSHRQAAAVLMRSLPQRAPEEAWSWLLQQDHGTDQLLVRAAAEGFARRAVGGGIAILPPAIYELREDLRGAWVTTFASTYAQSEPEAAVDWLQGFRNDPAYEEWAMETAEALATPGARGSIRAPLYPRPAAAIVSTLLRPSQEITASVAIRWAHQEPRETLQWALNLADSSAQITGVAAAVGAWTVDDPDAARQWVLALPSGDLRDRAMAAQLAQEISSHGSADWRIFNAFSSHEAFQGALNRPQFAIAFRSLGSRDPERAKELVDSYIDDGNLKERVLEEIELGSERGRETPRGMTLSVLP